MCGEEEIIIIGLCIVICIVGLFALRFEEELRKARNQNAQLMREIKELEKVAHVCRARHRSIR